MAFRKYGGTTYATNHNYINAQNITLQTASVNELTLNDIVGNIYIADPNPANSDYRIVFTQDTNNTTLPLHNFTELKYNPDTNTLTSGVFSGDIVGNVHITGPAGSEKSPDSIEYRIVFTQDTYDKTLPLQNFTGLKYNPGTNTLTTGSVRTTSDYRTKTNIEELDETITVSNLRPLTYIKNGKKEIGLIAHELQEVYPFMVCGEKDGEQMQSVNYNGLIGVLINDVKRLNNENKILKSDYETLKSRIDTLEEKNNKKFE
jgi:hypothetical protein